MAIAIDTTSNAQEASGATSKTFSHTCSGSNRVLVVSVIASATGDPSGVTYNSVALTKAVSSNTPFNTSIWYLANPATGANNIVVSFGSSTKFGVGAISLTGCNTDSPLGITGSSEESFGDTRAIVTVTSQKNNSYLIDAMAVNGNPTVTLGGSQTSIVSQHNAGDNYREHASYKAATTAGSFDMEYTWTGNAPWQMCVAEIRGDASVTITDTLSLSDTIAAGFLLSATVTDTLTLSDNIAASYIGVATILDTLALSDTITVSTDLLWEPRTRPSSPSWTTTGTAPSNSWLQNNDWHYVYTGIKTPVDDGWTLTSGSPVTPGDFVQTASLGVYRGQAAGTVNSRLDYSFPQIGSVDFATGITVEWYAKYSLSSGTSQSNVYVGDDNEIIRLLYIQSNITIRSTGGSVLYTDSTTDKTTYHKYKITVLGTAINYYVDDTLITSVTNSGSGSVTNYVRIGHRCDAGQTYDVSYQYIRVRRGVSTDTITSWTPR